MYWPQNKSYYVHILWCKVMETGRECRHVSRIQGTSDLSMCWIKYRHNEMYRVNMFPCHYQWVSIAICTAQWFSPGTPVTSNNKTDLHKIIDILLKVALNTINQTNHNNLPVINEMNEEEWLLSHLIYLSFQGTLK